MTEHGTSFRCAGVRIDALDLDDAADAVVGLAASRRPAAVHLCNAYTLSLADEDPALTETLARGDLNLPDGMPLVWIARRLGIPISGRVYGPDLMLAVLDRGREHGLRHYLYGSSPEVIDRLAASLAARLPGLRIAGAESPPFRALSADEKGDMVERLSSSGADIVWVGIGTPRQDVFVDEFREAIGVPLVAVGAAFDFHAGLKRQAPAWLQDRGLEWAFRLATEPRRLWRRYLIGNARFVRSVIADRPVRVG